VSLALHVRWSPAILLMSTFELLESLAHGKQVGRSRLVELREAPFSVHQQRCLIALDGTMQVLGPISVGIYL